MLKQTWNNAAARSELERLIVPGLLGFYDQVEVTDVFMRSEDRKIVSSIITVAVLEETTNEDDGKFRFLNKNPIQVGSIKGATFGIARYEKPIEALLPAIYRLLQKNEWALSGKPPLLFEPLSSAGCQFVPPDTMSSIPLNLVLKNNFWNGSYVFEWADRKKAHLNELFERPQRLQDLSEAVQKYVPMHLAGLSDRLGNLIIQLPARILISGFRQSQHHGDLVADVVWHPKATPRSLKAICRFDFDSSVEGFAAASFSQSHAVLPARAERGTYVATIWDEANQVVLASTDTSSFIESIPIAMHIVDPEPRVLAFNVEGQQRDIRVAVINKHTTVVGRMPGEDWNGGRTFKRMYQSEVAKLKEQRRFVHYNPRQGDRSDEHRRALEDIRLLINTYGEHGVWLWDPYLTAFDIMETLVYCPYINADLRGMGSNKEALGTAGRVSRPQRGPYVELWRSIVRIFREPPPTVPSRLLNLVPV
jgi:hypothetical protein